MENNHVLHACEIKGDGTAEVLTGQAASDTIKADTLAWVFNRIAWYKYPRHSGCRTPSSILDIYRNVDWGRYSPSRNIQRIKMVLES